MKTLDDIIKRLQPEKQKEIASFLSIKSVSETRIKESLLNVFTINRLLSSLDRHELKIFRLLYTSEDGLSFGDIQKHIDISIDEIEKALNNLSSMLLAYVIKNRQMLNKKMDKAFNLPEIAEIIKIRETSDIKDYLQKSLDSLIDRLDITMPDKNLDEKGLNILRLISERGGIITINTLEELITSPDQERKINDLINKGNLRLFNVINDRHTALVTIDEKLIPQVAMSGKKGNIPAGISINNYYNMCINLLKTYDSVSASGLFLTKQNKFRKIDIKKISEKMLNLSSYSGEEIDEEEKAFISMQILNILHCLKLDRDIGIISLKPVADRIEEPALLLKTIYSKISEGAHAEGIFCGSYKLPFFHNIKIIITLLSKFKPVEFNYLKLAFIISNLISGLKKSDDPLSSYISTLEVEFARTLDFIIISGVAAVDKGKIHITETGRRLHSLLAGKKYTRTESTEKSIYISPDFTLMINDRDIDPESLYKIMSFTDIIKEDVVIEAAITKSSIINSRKRGMNIEIFLETLKNHAKNDIPQSLDFLINDWTKQTISVRISRPVIIYSSHSTFIDDILYSNYSKAVIHRISENYAIISLDSIDDIVKFSKKYDIILTIFEEEEI